VVQKAFELLHNAPAVLQKRLNMTQSQFLVMQKAFKVKHMTFPKIA
jgi:hypothetical protein